MGNSSPGTQSQKSVLESPRDPQELIQKLQRELELQRMALQDVRSELQASRRQLSQVQALFDGMTEGFAVHEIVCDEKGEPVDYIFLDVNPAFERLTGLRRQDVLGRRMLEVLPGNDPEWVAVYGRVALTGEPIRFENYATPLKRHYQVYAYRPAPRQFAVLFVDITERKVREKELGKLNRVLHALGQSSHAMTQATDELAYSAEVCRIIQKDCGYAMVWIGVAAEDEGKSIRPTAYAGFEEGYLETLHLTWADAERGRGPTGMAIRTGKPSSCRNMLTDPNFLPWRQEALRRGYAASIALPLIADGKAFGAITIYSKEPDPFSEDEIGLLTEIANDLAYGITSLRLREIKRRAEEALRENEARFRTLIEHSSMLAGMMDQDGRFTVISQSAAALFGYEGGEAQNKCWKDVIPQSQWPMMARALAQAQTQGEQKPTVVVTQFHCKEREKLWVEWELLPVVPKGEPRGTYVTWRNLGENLLIH